MWQNFPLRWLLFTVDILMISIKGLSLQNKHLQRKRHLYQRAKDKKIEDQEDARSLKVKIQDHRV